VPTLYDYRTWLSRQHQDTLDEWEEQGIDAEEAYEEYVRGFYDTDWYVG